MSEKLWNSTELAIKSQNSQPQGAESLQAGSVRESLPQGVASIVHSPYKIAYSSTKRRGDDDDGGLVQSQVRVLLDLLKPA